MTQDPYAIWVSEIMLQQTQIATVIPYYRRFLRVFPDCKSLAAAQFENVAELWSGLGYYRRARMLHRGAKKVMEEFGGHFPEDYDSARQIPGVGHYTASAVLSIAYGVPLPVLDGNVARVIARLDALKGPPVSTVFRRAVERRLSLLISVRKPGSFNQGLMELGQTICLPRAPRCYACPLHNRCRASKMSCAETFPAPRPRRGIEPRHLATAIIREGDTVALVRGLDERLLEDLWNFPSAFGESRKMALENLKSKLEEIAGTPIRWRGRVGSVRHGITFRSIRADLYPAELLRRPKPDLFRWISPARIDGAAVSQLARKIAAMIRP